MRGHKFYCFLFLAFIANFFQAQSLTFLQNLTRYVKHNCDEYPSVFLLSNPNNTKVGKIKYASFLKLNIDWVALPKHYSGAAVNKKSSYSKIDQQEIVWGDINEYEIGEFLGDGTYGQVYKAYKNNQTYIIKLLKEMSKPNQDNVTHMIAAEKEIKIYKALANGPNIAQLYRAVRDPKNQSRIGYVNLIMEYVQMESHEILYPRLTKEDIKYYMYMILKAINYAHSQGIMHRDLKPHNVAIDPQTKKVRILDWGIADVYLPNKTYTPFIGTKNYRAPEILLHHPLYYYAVDMWSVGCIFASMLFNTAPFYRAENEYELLRKINRHLGTRSILQMMNKHKIYWPFKKSITWRNKQEWEVFINESNQDRISPEALHLLSTMLVIDFEDRITAKEAVAHPYFDSVRKVVEAGDMSHLFYTKDPET